SRRKLPGDQKDVAHHHFLFTRPLSARTNLRSGRSGRSGTAGASDPSDPAPPRRENAPPRLEPGMGRFVKSAGRALPGAKRHRGLPLRCGPPANRRHRGSERFGLALRVLRRAAGLVQTGLLALDGAGVAGEEAGLLQLAALLRVVLV